MRNESDIVVVVAAKAGNKMVGFEVLQSVVVI